MASRKLNLKQLVTLSEVYWDDPAKLAEILGDLHARLEPDADALLQTVLRRIELLRTNPEAAKAQKPPSQTGDAAVTDAAMSDAPQNRERRRRVVAVIIAAAALGVGAWFLWPRPQTPDDAVATAQGPEITLQGERPGEPQKDPATQVSPPPGARRVTPDLDRPQAPPRADLGNAAVAPASDRAGPRIAAAPRERAITEPAELAEPAPPAESGPPASRPERDQASGIGAGSNRAGAGSSRSGASTAAAEAGIVIDDTQLACDRSDSHAESCDAPAAGAAAAAAAARAAPTPAARPASSPAPADGGSSPSDPASPRPNAPPPAAAASRAASSAGGSNQSPPASPAGAGGASGGGADSSAGGSSPSSGGKGPAATRKDSARAPPEITLPPEQTAEAPPPSVCPPAPEDGRVVFILDGSISMGLPLDVDAALEDELDDGIRRHDPQARRDYRALLAEPGPKRITRAREAFAAAVSDLPDKVDLGLVVFQECRDIRSLGIFEAARRGAAIDYVRKLVPKGRTPLADSLRRAADMLGDGRSSIVLLTDGREFCDGDPCAAAAEVKASHPGTPIHIVDITGQAKAECVADATGGRSYKPDATADLSQVVRNAFRGAAAQCGASAESSTTVESSPPR